MTPAGQNTHPTPRYRSVNQLIPCVTCVIESSRGEKRTKHTTEQQQQQQQQVPAGSAPLSTGTDRRRPSVYSSTSPGRRRLALLASSSKQQPRTKPTAQSAGRIRSVNIQTGVVKVTRTRPLRSEPGRAALSSARRCVQIPIAAPAERLPSPSEQAVRV